MGPGLMGPSLMGPGLMGLGLMGPSPSPRNDTIDLGTRTLYHATDQAGADGIRSSGMQMVRGTRSGAFGKGIYFADTPEEARRKANANGYLVTARVRLGRAKVVHATESFTANELRRQ